MTTSPRAAGRWSPARWLGLALALAAALSLVEALAIRRGLPSLVALAALAAYAAATTAAFGAAAAFGPQDHLRRAWGLVGGLYLGLGLGRLLFPGDLLGLPDIAALAWLRAAITLAANACGVAGIALFAVTWLRTGLPLPGSRGERRLVAAVLFAATMLLVGPDLVASTAAALRGDVYAGAVALGDAADVVMFLLLVPVFITARGLAGGRLAWPFALLCAADVAWMLLDGFATYGELLAVEPSAARAVTGALRTTGCLMFAAAAVTQRLAIRGPARGAERP
jgi:hypothetical protein